MFPTMSREERPMGGSGRHEDDTNVGDERYGGEHRSGGLPSDGGGGGGGYWYS
jgi:hypothetical protein